MQDNDKDLLRHALRVLFLNERPDQDLLGFDSYRGADIEECRMKCVTILFNAITGLDEWRI